MPRQIKKALILAAGRGSRLKNLTSNKPKPLLKIFKKTLIEMLIDKLYDLNFNKIVVITGYKADRIKKKLKNKVKYHFYPGFLKTNNLHTLLHAKKELNKSLLCLFSDVIFDFQILKKLIKSVGSIVLAVDKKARLKGTMRVKTQKDNIIEIGNQIDVKKCDGNFIGFAKFTKTGCKVIKNELKKYQHSNYNDYYTIIFNNLAKKRIVKFIDVSKYKWKEIDNHKDLVVAKKIYKKILNEKK